MIGRSLKALSKRWLQGMASMLSVANFDRVTWLPWQRDRGLACVDYFHSSVDLPSTTSLNRPDCSHSFDC